MKILIVKLGALGDVLRTTPLLTALKSKYPDSRITWVVDGNNSDVLKNNPLIDEVLSYAVETPGALARRSFDWAINLDKEPEALETISAANAIHKKGFGRSGDGKLVPLDTSSDYAYRLGIDDELKFKLNRKTYQEISFEQAELIFQGEEYVFHADPLSESAAKAHLKALGFDRAKNRPVVGLNTGSGRRFAGKRLPVATFVRLTERSARELGATVFLLGGEDEKQRNLEIQKKVSVPVTNTGSHPIRIFAGIVRECDVVLSGDTTAMHIAIAVKTPVTAYFASTCASEIELYGRGVKIVSGIECAPCYKKICPIDEKCMSDMDPDVLFSAIKDVLSAKGARVAR